MDVDNQQRRELDQAKGYLELTFPGRQFIVWLFDDHTKYENRLMDTPVNFVASDGIGGEKRGTNLMKEKIKKWESEGQ